MAPSTVHALHVGRRGSWALPARAPETWVGPRASWAAAAVAAVAVLLCLQPVIAAPTRTVLALSGLGCAGSLAAVTAAFSLLVQQSVSGDRALLWISGGYAAMVPLFVARVQLLGSGRPGQAALAAAAVLLAGTLALLPAAALGLGPARPAPALPVLALATVLVATPLWAWWRALRAGPATTGAPSTPVRIVLLTAAGLSLLAAVRWRARRPGGPARFVAAGLLANGFAGVAWAASSAPFGPSFWVAEVAEVLAVTVPAAGLALVSGAGYRRQSRRWRQLVTQVGMLRAASPLLPGRSVTPEDDEGLPQPAEVRALIDDGRVRVALQPVVRLSDGSVMGFEALSRFGGRVSTDRWFRGASHCGLGGELERLTLQAALNLLDRLPEDVFLAVNVSPVALLDPTVQALLHDSDLSRVVVEVTEHEAVADYDRARRMLERLRLSGARIAVDDTGAGFASLRHVLMLQPDIIKLDTSLTRDVHGNRRQQELVDALATFAAEVGSVVLAEGIETEDQLQALRALRVPLGQGWHLGVPTVVQSAPPPRSSSPRSPAS